MRGGWMVRSAVRLMETLPVAALNLCISGVKSDGFPSVVWSCLLGWWAYFGCPGRVCPRSQARKILAQEFSKQHEIGYSVKVEGTGLRTKILSFNHGALGCPSP